MSGTGGRHPVLPAPARTHSCWSRPLVSKQGPDLGEGAATTVGVLFASMTPSRVLGQLWREPCAVE